jgi:hypothetical protein
MNHQLRQKILDYNRNVTGKVRDMDVLIGQIGKLPPGQLKKVLTEDVLAILRKYGVQL